MATNNPTTKSILTPETSKLPGSCDIPAFIHEMECLLSIIQSINEIADPRKKSYLVDAADSIGTRILENLNIREDFEDEECRRGTMRAAL